MTPNLRIGGPDGDLEGMEITFTARGDIGVVYGELRLAVAAHFDIDPADVTADQVAEYEKEQG